MGNMAVKMDEQSSRASRTEKADRHVAVEIHSSLGTDEPSGSDTEQLSRQAGRVLEQLIALDEQYRDLIVQHDQSAAEALTACTVALSKLAYVRSFQSRMNGSLPLNVTRPVSEQGCPSDRRCTK